MEIIINDEGTAHQSIQVKDIGGDMGEDPRMQLLQQPDGDVIISLYNVKAGTLGSIEFCTSSGGGRQPIIAQRLRDLIRDLMAGGTPRPKFTQLDPVEVQKLWQSGERMMDDSMLEDMKQLYSYAENCDGCDDDDFKKIREIGKRWHLK